MVSVLHIQSRSYAIQDNKELIELYKKMKQRYEANKALIDRDYLGDPSKLYWQNWELKFWKEYIERHFGLKEGKDV